MFGYMYGIAWFSKFYNDLSDTGKIVVIVGIIMGLSLVSVVLSTFIWRQKSKDRDIMNDHDERNL